MIVSGGVNIYPQEIEDVLLAHPKVLDVAVFGVPNAEMGEEVKAVVQPVAGAEAGEALAAELQAWCEGRLAHYKWPPASISTPSCRDSTTGSSTRRRSATGTGKGGPPGWSEPLIP